MIKCVLLCMSLFMSSLAFAGASELTEQQLESNVSDSLDAIISCNDVPLFLGNPLGQMIGKWWHHSQVRAPYYDNYIYPLLNAVQTSEETVNFRALPEYEKMMEMMEYDELFSKCPEKVPAFVFALDSWLETQISTGN